jgi:carboxyl-terminal processing protease
MHPAVMKTTWSWRSVWLRLALAWVGAIATLPASAQHFSLPSHGGASISEFLDRGQALEIERRWSEAVATYEDALRHFPGDPAIKQRFDVARQHFDVARRYADRSFRAALERLSPSATLDLYGEVLLKIHAHYVDTPRWQELVEAGTRSLAVALSESAFLETNFISAKPEQVNALLADLERLLAARPIQTRFEAREAVQAAAALAQRQIGVGQNAVVMEFLSGAVNTLDPYSTYLTPDQLNEVYSQIEGNFVGLGVELKAQNGALLILRVIPRSPASRGGLREGDRIVAIDGRETRDLSADRAANLLQGEPGSVADITIERPDASLHRLLIRRERVEVPGVDQAGIRDRSRGIAYLKLGCFQKSTCRDVEDALWKLHREGMRSLVIDLRGNPGGLLVAAVEVADLFLDRGVIVTTHGRNAYEDFTYTAREPGTWHVPLVVLIDQDSASAAEIFAGAIRDQQRGTIVGRRSFGKGSVQGIFPLGVGGAGLRLTTAKFFSPLGRPYSGLGVEPHVVVRQTARPSGDSVPGPSEDPLLAAALQVASQLVAQRPGP